MQSVIGVFDTREDAELARESLVRAGFDEDDVRVQSHRSVDDSDGSSQSRSEEEDEGFMARVGHFFSDLFGSDDDSSRYAGHYAEHVRRGGSVVVVDVDDEDRVNEARAALASAGAVDIDSRTEAWREEGYAGFDAESQPYSSDEVQAERNRGDRVPPGAQEDMEVSKRRVDLGAVRVVSRADRGAIELEERIERVVEDMPVGQRSSAEADMGVGMSSSYSTARGADSGSDTMSAARTFDDNAQSAMSWKERQPNAPAHDDRMGAAGSSMNADDDMAYRYGTTLRSDQRYAGRASWDEIEADARADWSQRNPNSNWERAKAAVRSGWESMTGRR